MARNDFWTHGVTAQIEWPNKIHDGGPNTPLGHPRRHGVGLRIRQKANTDNWFSLAIPTPTIHRNDASIYIERVFIDVELNENAVIEGVHLRIGNYHKEDLLNGILRGPEVFKTFECRKEEVNRGVNVCIRVAFKTGDPMGFVQFMGAGAMFVQY